MNSPDVLAEQLNLHFYRKVEEAKIKFGHRYQPIVMIGQKLISELGAINATPREFDFLLQWQEEVRDIIKGEPTKPTILRPDDLSKL